MKKYKIGVLNETKNPPDKRVAVTPKVGKELLKKFPTAELFVQHSNIRAFKEEEYLKEGITVIEDLSNCDILIGVKEVNIKTFIPNKTYIFFSHVAKKQPYNRGMLLEMMKKKITLIDYEYLTNSAGMRVVAFGKWAGIVGAYKAIRIEGIRNDYFHIKPAYEYKDKKEMYKAINGIKLRPVKIVITGGGRVATGAMETLNACNVKMVSPQDFLNNTYDEAVYTKLEPWNYVKHKNNKEFDLQHFFDNPAEYVSTFKPYTKIANIYIPCHFWDPKSPVFFTKEEAKKDDFSIKIIADVSCDIAKPIPSTLRASTIAEPYFDYNPFTEKEEPAFSNKKNITVMSVDNLPGELPRDASKYFSTKLLNNVFSNLLFEGENEMIKNATIIKNGTLTDKFSYLQDYIDGK